MVRGKGEVWITKKNEKVFRVDVCMDSLFYCSDGLTGIYINQNSPNNTTNICSLLYINYTSIKLKIHGPCPQGPWNLGAFGNHEILC